MKDAVPSFPADPPRRVAVLLYPGTMLLDVAGPAQVFEAASTMAQARGGVRAYEIAFVSRGGGPVVTDLGAGLQTAAWNPARPCDTLLVPGGPGAWDAARDPDLLAAVRVAAAGVRRTASVCLGAFVLAAAGLLDGRRAATHWRHCAALQERHPRVRVEPEPIFVRDDPVWTSAGVSAGIDLALAMVEADLGHAAALEVAQRLVVFLKRPGGQAQFSQALRAQASDRGGGFAGLHAWMADNLSADLRVERLAERAGMSPRHFARAYRERTGRTPAKAVEALRVEAARRLLQRPGPGPGVAGVAHACGFGDEERMRRAFVRCLGVPPAAYRTRFGRES